MAIEAPYFHAKLNGGQVATHGPAYRLLSRNLPDDATDPLGGLFLEWRWDGATLTVRNDRFGMYPAYYYADFPPSNDLALNSETA